MNRLITAMLISAISLFIITACSKEDKGKVSADEIPLIKMSLAGVEDAIRDTATGFSDSLLSTDASDAGTTGESVLRYIYADNLNRFIGFTDKRIFYRDDAARIDCNIAGFNSADSVPLPDRPVTITMKKEGEHWKLKKIEPRLEDPLKEEGE